MSTRGWADEMLARLDAPEAWSPARLRAEDQWAQIWRGPVGFAISGDRVVTVERKKKRGLTPWREAA
jgi:hypothetical protein